MPGYTAQLYKALIIVACVKFAIELSALFHLKSKHQTPLKQSAALLVGDLSMITVRRFFLGVLGGLIVPAILFSEKVFSSEGYHPLFLGVAAALMLGLLLAGELHARYLFFAASVAPRMPGGSR